MEVREGPGAGVGVGLLEATQEKAGPLRPPPAPADPGVGESTMSPGL